MLVVRCLSRFAATAAFAMFLSLGGAPANALYDVKPGEIPGKPGTIIRVWPLEAGGPANSDAFHFLYRSTGSKGEPIPVSGAIFIPSGPAPAGGRIRVVRGVTARPRPPRGSVVVRRECFHYCLRRRR